MVEELSNSGVDRLNSCIHGIIPDALYPMMMDALSTSAGKAYLARMEEAVRLLSAVENYEGTIITEDIKWFEWNDRRDILLEQLKGGV